LRLKLNYLDIFKHIYDIFIEISPFLLLGLFFVGLLHIFFSKEFIVKHIGKDSVGSIVKASILGVPLPLCSCGVIPTAIYMAKNGASKGAVISFLISTPQTGIDSIMATYGMLGWVFAIYRPVIAFVSGILGGIIVNIFSKEPMIINVEESKKVEASSCSSGSCNSTSCDTAPVKKQNALTKFYNYAFVEFLDDIAVHFIIGIIISGLISFFIPEEFFIKYSLGSGILGMLVMVAIGLPMYICATASIPIAITLMLKGISPGAAFVFLTVGPLTNAASLAILAKIFTKKVMLIYVTSASIIAIIAGLSLDFIVNTFSLQKFVIPTMASGHMHEGGWLHTVYLISAFIFALMLISSLYRRYIAPKFKKKNKRLNMMNTLKINIEGMSCNHCVNNIEDTLLKQDNIDSASVDLPTNSAEITGRHVDKNIISSLIENLGYKVVS
jgi:uncharacterized membrane protein YraQ (UPF0718 family)/copper chaperone CopZ